MSVEVEGRKFLLGENVLLHFCIENTGDKPFNVSFGGDYRGSPRHLRFTVLATDVDGKEVPDPHPNPMCMGGLGYTKDLKPGEKHHESLALLRYRRFEKPGVYRLRVSHDLGWTERDDSKFPSAEVVIEFVQPTEKEARQLVEGMYQLPKEFNRSSGQKAQPFADFQTLHHPVYLPILAPRAAGGCERALEGIGEIPTPEATRELIRLARHEDPAFALNVVKTLNARLPDPKLEGKLPSRSPFEFDFEVKRRWLVKHSWKPEFTDDVRKIGRDLLEKDEVNKISCGAYIVQCLGGAEELRHIVKALDTAATNAAKVREMDRYPRPRGACEELVRATQMLGQRGVRLKEEPRSPGEQIVYACTLSDDDKARPKKWEDIFAKALQSDIPYVRECALNHLPVPPPDALGKLLPGLIEDRDIDVAIAACRVAEKWKSPSLHEAVLRSLAVAREHWHFNAVGNAAHALGLRFERLEILVTRLDEQGMTHECLSSLVYLLLDGLNGHGSQTDLDADTGKTCKAAWEQFLAKHRPELKKGRKFRLDDPTVPLAELFPKFTFERPRKADSR
jgi:hypothetical protein